MRHPSIRGYLSILMMLALPVSTMLADTHAAMAYVQGSATVNGLAVSQSAAIFPGDAIQTATGSTVSLTLKGSTILVPGGSAVTFRETEVAVTSGSAQVRTSGGMRARAAGISVAPASAKPVAFEVARLGGKIRITVVSGSVAISDGKATTLLEGGKSITLEAGGNGLPRPAAPKSSITGETGLIIAVIAGVAAGVAVGIANAQDASPSVP